MFAVFMNPSSTALQIAFSTPVNWNTVVNTPALPLNVKTAVTVEVVGLQVTVKFNGAQVAALTLGGPRYAGPGYLYASNPWLPAANAVFGGYSLQKV